MSRLAHYLRRAKALPPRIVLAKARRHIARAGSRRWQRWLDARRPTYSRHDLPLRAGLFRAPPASALNGERAVLRLLCENVLRHRFDLLGSGAVEVRHGMACAGVAGHRYPAATAVEPDPEGRWLADRVGPANAPEARRIWRLVDPGYVPIDWQLDFKSGHRWSERTWYLDVDPHAIPPGADIKVPWELARCQHLPQLALEHLARGGAGDGDAEALAREFRNQVLDFIAANPPRFGVNWVCAMDVAIRIANWLVARDLFLQGGAVFDAEFERVLARSAWEHAAHVAANLEWTEGLRSNHYLADVCGLLFAAAYLGDAPGARRWLAFALGEVVRETAEQFYPEGSNKEASTSYHRLSGEMIVYAAAFALGLPADCVAGLERIAPRAVGDAAPAERPEALVAGGRIEFPAWFGERLQRMAEFSRDLTRPSGEIVQIGDNDSGRFLKLPGSYAIVSAERLRARYRVPPPDAAAGSAPVLDERVLDHSRFVAAVAALTATDASAAVQPVDAAIVAALAGGRRLAGGASGLARQRRVGAADDCRRFRQRLAALPADQCQRYEFAAAHGGLREGLESIAYPEFGVYVIRSGRLFVAIRCGRLAAGGSGSHAHNDPLAVEIELDGELLAADPGTYVYTPLPAERNRYRSAAAHFVPLVEGREPASLEQGLFVLQDTAQAACEYFGELGFCGSHRGYGAPVLRSVQVTDVAVVVEDGYVAGPLARWSPALQPPFSPKYGCLAR